MAIQLNALPTLPVLARTVSGCLNSAFLGLFYTSCGPAFQAMDTQLGARQRRRTPTIYRGRAQRTILAGSWFGQGSSCPGDARRRHRVGVEVGLVMAASRMPGLDRELQIMGRLRVFLTFVLAISREDGQRAPTRTGHLF